MSRWGHVPCRECDDELCAECHEAWPCYVGRCGRLMPRAGERCNRTPGHADRCQSEYDMANDRRSRRAS